jgi:hypothetical protein
MVLIVRAWVEGDGQLRVRLIEAVPNRGSVYVASIEAAEEILRDRLTKLLKDHHTGSR